MLQKTQKRWFNELIYSKEKDDMHDSPSPAPEVARKVAILEHLRFLERQNHTVTTMQPNEKAFLLTAVENPKQFNNSDYPEIWKLANDLHDMGGDRNSVSQSLDLIIKKNN